MNKTIISLLVLNILIALGGYAFPAVVSQFGGEGDTNLTNLVLSGTLSASATSTLGAVRTGNLVSGGSVTPLTASNTITLVASNICSNSVIQWSATHANASFTLPTAAALYSDCMGAVGSQKWLILEFTSSTATTTVVAANASTTLIGRANTDDVLEAGRDARLHLIITGTDTMDAVIEELVDAD